MDLGDYIEQKYRDGMERIASQLGTDVKLDVPSLSNEPIPARDALDAVTEMTIAIERAKDRANTLTFNCWKCKSPIALLRQEHDRTVRCPQCGKKQATPRL